MPSFRSVLLALFALQLCLAVDPPIEAADDIKNPSSTPNLHVSISASFPQSEIFGIKLVNGRATEALLSISNEEPEPVALQMIGGSLWTPEYGDQQPSRIVRNLSTSAYKSEIPAGEKESFTYKFATDLHPTDLVLKLVAVVTDSKGAYYTMSAFDNTVSVVEAPTSIFDPQIIFLYLMLAGGFLGTSYFIYTTWITTLFPQAKRRGGKGGERAKTSSRGTKRVDPSDQVSVTGADGPAVASGSKAYDESWIPSHHIQRPEAKRIRSGTPSGVKVKSRAA